MIGMLRRSASRTAIASVFMSTTNIASGGRCMLRTPPRLYSSLSRSFSAAIRSRVGSSSSVPFSVQSVELVQALDALRHRLEVGEQPTEPALVHVGHPGGRRRLGDRVARLLLGADEQHGAAAAGDLRGELLRLREQPSVFWRSMMWMPLRSPKMKRRIFGFQRRVWWPK